MRPKRPGRHSSSITTVAGESAIPPNEFGERGVGVATGRVLEPGTTYYYRVFAENEQSRIEGKPAEGTVQEFTTPAAEVPVVAGESVSGLTSTAAKLEATVDPNDQATTYAFEYATNKTLVGATKVAGALPAEYATLPVSTVLSGRMAHETYYYRVVAENEKRAKKQARRSTGRFSRSRPLRVRRRLSAEVARK